MPIMNKGCAPGPGWSHPSFLFTFSPSHYHGKSARPVQNAQSQHSRTLLAKSRRDAQHHGRGHSQIGSYARHPKRCACFGLNKPNPCRCRAQERRPANPRGQAGTLLDTALDSGKKWIENSGLFNGVNQLPQDLKGFGSRALNRVNSLSTTQKMVDSAILAAGIGWLAGYPHKEVVIIG